MPDCTQERKPMYDGPLTVRLAHSGDAAAITRLIEMEQSRPLRGQSLVAELDGTIVAALSLHDGQVVADLFRPTTGIVRTLRHWRAEFLEPRRPLHMGPVQRSQEWRRLVSRRRAEAWR
jgi:hypothetical protein